VCDYFCGEASAFGHAERAEASGQELAGANNDSPLWPSGYMACHEIVSHTGARQTWLLVTGWHGSMRVSLLIGMVGGK
jgi:hypothetical protein